MVLLQLACVCLPVLTAVDVDPLEVRFTEACSVQQAVWASDRWRMTASRVVDQIAGRTLLTLPEHVPVSGLLGHPEAVGAVMPRTCTRRDCSPCAQGRDLR